MSARSTVVSLPTRDAADPVTGYAVYYGQTVPTYQRLGVDSDTPTRTVTTLEPGFALFLPYVVTTATTVTRATLLSILGGVYPGIPENNHLPVLGSGNNGLIQLSHTIVSFTAGGATLWVPLTNVLAQTVDMNPGITALRNAASATPTSAPTSDISSAGTSISATRTGGSTTLTSRPATLQTVEPGPDDDETGTSTATLAGGIVGGVLAAILLCGLLGFFLVRRKRSKRSASATHAHASEKGDPNAPGTKSSMAGSQKQQMDSTNPLVVEVVDSSAIPISDLWLAPEGGRLSWWQRLRTK